MRCFTLKSNLRLTCIVIKKLISYCIAFEKTKYIYRNGYLRDPESDTRKGREEKKKF